jgi:Ubiquitin elongating factor core
LEYKCHVRLCTLQVRGLLQLFHDVEHTDRSNTFYEKFNTRYKAGEILREFAHTWQGLVYRLKHTVPIRQTPKLSLISDRVAAVYLWTIPAHREVWKALAAEQDGKGLYLAFADVICNDSQYLLDDVIRSLPEVCGPRVCYVHVTAFDRVNEEHAAVCRCALPTFVDGQSALPSPHQLIPLHADPMLHAGCVLQIRELEDLMADTARWEALSPQERKEKQQHFNTTSECSCLDSRAASPHVVSQPAALLPHASKSCTFCTRLTTSA